MTCARVWTRVLAIGFALALPFACTWTVPDFQRPLPNGYVLVDTSSGIVSVTDPRCLVLVGPTVDLLGVREHTVVGHVSPDPSRDPRIHTVGGYFMLDTRTGTLDQGLAKDDWERRLGPPPTGLYKPVRLETDRNENLCQP